MFDFLYQPNMLTRLPTWGIPLVNRVETRGKVAFSSMFLKRKKSQRFGASHTKKIPLPPLGRSYGDQKNQFEIGRNSERCCYHTDLSRFVLPISDPSNIEFLTICRIAEFPKSEQNRKSCGNVRIGRKRAAVRLNTICNIVLG